MTPILPHSIFRIERTGDGAWEPVSMDGLACSYQHALAVAAKLAEESPGEYEVVGANPDGQLHTCDHCGIIVFGKTR